jgi:hypothetical protein
MGQVRLKSNLIFDGKHYARGTVMDRQNIPLKFRTSEYCGEIGDREGLVLLLTDVNYMQEVKGSDGRKIHMQATMGADTVVELGSIPEKTREELVEGTHYVTDWDEQELYRRQMNVYDEPAKYDRLTKLHARDQFGNEVSLDDES